MPLDLATTGVIVGANLLTKLGEAIFGSAQAEQKAIQQALAEEGKAKQQVFAEQAQKTGQSLSGLVEAYRSSLMG